MTTDLSTEIGRTEATLPGEMRRISPVLPDLQLAISRNEFWPSKAKSAFAHWPMDAVLQQCPTGTSQKRI